MHDCKSLTPDETLSRLEAIEKPLILMHIRPDGDTYGSAAALAVLFSLMGKTPALFCADKIPDRLSFISDFLPPVGDPDESGRTAVAVDVASAAQLGGAEKYAPVLTIDHHALSTPFSDHLTVKEACAAGEILFLLAEKLYHEKKIPDFPKNLADALYTAVSSDSGCFRYSNVTPQTHLAAARLIGYGADAARINRLLFDTKSENQLRAESLVAGKMKTEENGRISYAVITQEERDRAGLTPDDFETGIDILRSLRGVEISFILKESDKEKGVYKVSLRSNASDVAAVAAAFGGGGHIRAAGCTVRGETPEAAVSPVLSLSVKALHKTK